MIVIDSSVWIDYFRDLDTRATQWIEQKSNPQELALTVLVLCEVLQGARSFHDFSVMQEELLNFTVLGGDEIALAVAAAENYRILRSKGITVRKMADTLIATLCIRGKHELLHNDRDFDAFEKHLGLKVIHP